MSEEKYVVVTEHFWREGDKWYMWSSLHPDTVQESPIVVIDTSARQREPKAAHSRGERT